MKITTCLSRRQYATKPAPTDAAIISSEIASETKTISLTDFSKAIGKGQTFTIASGFKGNVRKAAKFKGVQIFAADIDNDNYSFDDILSLTKSFDLGEPALIYESFSSTAEYRKWRVVYIASEIVTDPTLCLAILRKIRNHFNADRSIVDLARILYGTTANKIRVVNDNATFRPLCVDIPIETRTGTNYVPTKKVPAKTSALKAQDKTVLKKVRYDIWFNSGPRYMSIFHGARRLAATGSLCRNTIHNYIITWISQTDRFKDYDRSQEEIENLINTAIDWYISLEDEQ